MKINNKRKNCKKYKKWMRGPGDIRPTHLGWKQVVWNFLKKIH
jgi:hypothetical protein